MMMIIVSNAARQSADTDIYIYIYSKSSGGKLPTSWTFFVSFGVAATPE